jgi:3,4-dihydroxy 2-butanone 4-phosphate synthase/GTP cyclohydrolase II
MSTPVSTDPTDHHDAFSTIEEALEDLAAGKFVVVVDDEDRENEGDLVIAAEHVTPDAINFMATHARGWICLALTSRALRRARPRAHDAKNDTPYETPFTVTIEAAEGVTTGISAADRAHTIRTAVDPANGPSAIVKGGHVNPLKAKPGGVLERTGPHRGVGRPRAPGRLPAGRRHLRDHERGRVDGPSSATCGPTATSTGSSSSRSPT